MHEYTSIKNWASEDRPREKLIQKGPESLSNAELLAILINTGTANKSAIDIAKDILEKSQQNLLEMGETVFNRYQKNQRNRRKESGHSDGIARIRQTKTSRFGP